MSLFLSTLFLSFSSLYSGIKSVLGNCYVNHCIPSCSYYKYHLQVISSSITISFWLTSFYMAFLSSIHVSVDYIIASVLRSMWFQLYIGTCHCVTTSAELILPKILKKQQLVTITACPLGKKNRCVSKIEENLQWNQNSRLAESLAFTLIVLGKL